MKVIKEKIKFLLRILKTKLKILQLILIRFVGFFFRKSLNKNFNQNLFHEIFESDIKLISTNSKLDIINQANKILNNKFDILNTNKNKWPKDINWHLDVNSGYSWPLKFFRNIHPVIPKGKSYEKKIPWDLNRLQFLFVLYKAYKISKKESYLNKIEFLINDWIINNPPFYGINWMNSMEVGIRASNLILITYLLRKKLKDETIKKVNKSLYYHLFYIITNPEIYVDSHLAKKRNKNKNFRFRNNHYFFNVVGVIFILFYFDNKLLNLLFKDKYLNLLNREINFQILDDGCNFEGSTSYHSFLLETIIYTQIFLKRNNVLLSKNIRERILKMIHFNFSIIKPDNNIPIIGDNDSGYLFHSLDDKIHSYRNFLASIFYNLTHHDNISKSYLIDNFIFIYSLDEINEFFLKRKKYNTCSKSFKNGGYYIMRNNKDFLITSINKNINMGTGGHHHNDSMSFELHSEGDTFISDPGCFSYSDKLFRNKFKSSNYHNIPVVDNKEINHIDYDNPFYLEDNAKTKVISWESNNDYDFFHGNHYGYSRFYKNFIVSRKINYNKSNRIFKITDEFSSDKSHEINWFFHTPCLDIIKNDNIFILQGKNVDLCFEVLNYSKNIKVKFIDGWISNKYGHKKKSKILNLNYLGSNFLNKKFEFKLQIIVKN